MLHCILKIQVGMPCSISISYLTLVVAARAEIQGATAPLGFTYKLKHDTAYLGGFQ